MTLAAVTPSSLLQLTRTGPRFSGTAADEERMRQEFARVPCLRFASLLAPELLQDVSRSLQEARFEEMLHAGIGTESCMEENRLWHQLNFLMNDSRLYALVERITGSGTIGCFQGRVYRVLPGKGHHDDWHNDCCDSRLIGVSVNLSPEPYSGGIFQLRVTAAGKMLTEVANIGPGDATLFRIGEELEHRITDVSGAAAKTAFAGWFRAQPDYRSMLAGPRD